MRNFLELIRNAQIEELSAQVFGQKLFGNSNASYTEVLSEDEETALMQEVLQADEETADKLYQFIRRYNEIYVISNKAEDVLVQNLMHPLALSLLDDIITRYGYSEPLGIKLSKVMLESKNKKLVLQLHRLLCNGRIFYSEIFNAMVRLDVRLQKSEALKEKAFAETYRQAVSNYRDAHDLKRFV